jgi:hypothetical protein
VGLAETKIKDEEIAMFEKLFGRLALRRPGIKEKRSKSIKRPRK